MFKVKLENCNILIDLLKSLAIIKLEEHSKWYWEPWAQVSGTHRGTAQHLTSYLPTHSPTWSGISGFPLTHQLPHRSSQNRNGWKPSIPKTFMQVASLKTFSTVISIFILLALGNDPIGIAYLRNSTQIAVTHIDTHFPLIRSPTSTWIPNCSNSRQQVWIEKYKSGKSVKDLKLHLLCYFLLCSPMPQVTCRFYFIGQLVTWQAHMTYWCCTSLQVQSLRNPPIENIET